MEDEWYSGGDSTAAGGGAIAAGGGGAGAAAAGGGGSYGDSFTPPNSHGGKVLGQVCSGFSVCARRVVSADCCGDGETETNYCTIETFPPFLHLQFLFVWAKWRTHLLSSKYTVHTRNSRTSNTNTSKKFAVRS